MPFQILKNNDAEIKKEFKKLITDQIKTDKEGIIIKADSLGSLEALLVLLKQENISVCKAGIGNINKKDVIDANTNFETNPLNAVILGFNVGQEEDLGELDLNKIKIIKQDVVYKLIEELKVWRELKQKEIEKNKLMRLVSVCKLKILKQYIFRNSNPAVFGVRVEAGKLKPGTVLIDEKGEEISNVKNIQADKETLSEAGVGMEIAISLPGVNFERQLADKEYLYSNVSAGMFKEFKKNKDLLGKDEIDVLQKISQIYRAREPTWGV